MFLTAVSLFAQTAIGRNSHGFLVPSAQLLPTGNIYIAAQFQIQSDGEPLAMDGYINEKTKNKFNTDNQSPTPSGNIQLAYGLFKYLELGLSLPIYYDGEIQGTNLKGSGLGDLQFSIKAAFPFESHILVNLGSDIYAPTGTKGKGFRARHIWYTDNKDLSYAYTSDEWAYSGTLYLTINANNLILWNNYIGYLGTTNQSTNVLLWGTGLEFFPQKIISFVTEISGETRLKKNMRKSAFWNEPARFTSGARLHFPHSTDLLFGANIGMDMFRKRKLEDGFNMRRNDHGQILDYTISGTPKIEFVFALTKTLDFSSTDSDGDGVPDRQDVCPETPFGYTVNNRGCPVDQDMDGILNILDDCPNTPFGVAVDYFGCPLDDDKDGIPNNEDQCPNTPSGVAVDESGCIKDSDSDGIDDNTDKCPDTKPEEKVNSFGCAIDEDHDGVLNESDKCPNTPEGWVIDQNGCPLDFDQDGVPDNLDQCPNTIAGEIVNNEGCPADNDNDGVPNSRDLCLDTPENYPVDSNGCPSDYDKDGVPDILDNCANTPSEVSVDTMGCPIDSDQDGVPDYLDQCPNTFPNILTDDKGCPYNNKLNLNGIAQSIQFRKNSDTFLNASYTALNDIIELMRRYTFKIVIQYSVSESNDKNLSEARAEAIVQYLIYKGINANRISTEIIDDSHPQKTEYKKQNINGIRIISTDFTK